MPPTQAAAHTCTMPACGLGLPASGLLLGLLLFTHLSDAGAGAEKPGVCPQLQERTDCAKECSTDDHCLDNLKCCQAGCSSVCFTPNGNPSATWQGQGGAAEGCERRELRGSGKKGTPDPGMREGRSGGNPIHLCPPLSGLGWMRGNKGVTEARPRGRRYPHSWLDSILWCMTGFRARTARLCSGTREQWLPWLETAGNPWVASGLNEEKLRDTVPSTNHTSPSEGGQVSTTPLAMAEEESNLEKQGTCPSVDFPKLGICEDQCQLDKQCPDNMKCCRNGCGKMTCATPTF
ncbi:WAP four-disulfide core domain protein 2 isoform X1 [Onychomys torridus]|uniref:WAP four-disulfide core domain protein 2 isoform X1 n=1 Tax=Onychomys torridus TaxID=38674 RepID=UPI00167FBEFE|nr:WAP four-disulfide core domain protein 2 isoform X1 [Onychomys torridus]